jgi:hypothetical protein
MPKRTEFPARSHLERTEPEANTKVHSKQKDLKPPPVQKSRSDANIARVYGLLLVALGAFLFILLGFNYERRTLVAMADFKPIFYGARCLLTGCALYSQEQVQRLYFAEGDEPQPEKVQLRDNIVLSPYPPATYMLVTPLAALPFRVAHVLWIILTSAAFLLAAFLMWDLGSRSAPVVSGFLVFLFLIGQELLIEVGNPSGLVIALCLIAVWCFLRNRFALAGILCLSVSLAVKPHDAGLVWLYFLAAGGLMRKRALQTLLCTFAMSLPAVVWVRALNPDWLTDLRHILVALSTRGGFNDPGPSAVDPRMHGSIVVSLQSAISLFRDEPHFYNSLTYLICGPLLIIWFVIGLRSRFSPSLAPLALAAISALSMLPIYHRQHDTGLLLLTVPACALLWSTTRWIGKCALFITAGAAFLLNNLSLQFLAIISAPLSAGSSGFAGQVSTLLLARPAPVLLLALSVLYLWTYYRSARKLQGPAISSAPFIPQPRQN